MVQIRTPTNQRIFPLWNTQALADALAKETGATNFGTYFGHSPTPERAIDCFTTIPMPRSNRVLGDRMADYVLNAVIKLANGKEGDVWEFFGIRYIIWRQRINYNDGRGWIAMENRGDDTQNHFDHDHISTNVIPRPASVGGQPPAILLGGNEVLIINVKDTGIFLLRGSEVTHLQHPDHVFAWVRAGVPYQDKVAMDAQVFKNYTGWGAQARGLMSAVEPEESEESEPVPYDEMITAVRTGLDDIYDEYIKELQVK